MEHMEDTSGRALADNFPHEDCICSRRKLLAAPFNVAAFQVSLHDPSLDLWCLHVADVPLSFLADPYQSDLLSAKELERYSTLRFQKDRNIYLARRILVRGVLSRHAGVQPWEWRFAENEFGKPCIAAKCCTLGLHFSVSSSSDLAVCIVAREPLSGVDVEDTHKPDAMEASELILSAEERIYLEQLPPHKRKHALLQYWTLKEAYLKARGIGLTLPLGDISFHRQRPTILVSLSKAIVHDPKGWRFQQYLLFNRYLTATAISGDTDSAMKNNAARLSENPN